MNKLPPSLFNDVIGPVMRGPSSSHTAASVRIGQMARQILGDEPSRVLIEFSPDGSLATTYESQGSAMGLAAGLMGWEITHPELPAALKKAEEGGLVMEFKITPFEAEHPNTYRINLEGKNGNSVSLIAISHGGGVVEIQSIDDFKMSMWGDFYEVLLFLTAREYPLNGKPEIHPLPSIEQVAALSSGDRNMIQMKLSAPPDQGWLQSIQEKHSVEKILVIDPVMPVLSLKNHRVPFTTAKELLFYAREGKMDLYRAALIYECQRSSLTEKQVFGMMEEIVTLLRESLHKGLQGTAYEDRILGYQSGMYSDAASGGLLYGDRLLNRVIAANMAMMEVKSSMGLIVAAPTAGSCAVLPGTLIPVADDLQVNRDELVKAFLAAGLIGVFIAGLSTFAAEECGCQAECGSASGMVAGGLVQMKGGTLEQGLSAASMALQNMIGLVCDPVANRVEVPCLGKNIQASLNGISSANMALAGLDPVIPLDEVILAMDQAGRSLPRTLRCTGLGGLSITPTSKKIEEQMKKL